TAPASDARIAPVCSAPALRLDLGRDCVVEPVLDNPKPFIELVLDVPSDDVQSSPGRAWEGRAPARPRCRGVAPLRYAGASADSKPASEWSASESGCCRPAARVRRRGRPGP